MRTTRILAVASAIDLDFRYGCTPAWWQLWKGMYEAGVDLVVTPYRGRPVESPWWRVAPNPAFREGESYQAVRDVLARLKGDRYLRRAEESPDESSLDRLTRETIRRWVTPRWRRHLERLVERERPDAIVVFTVPMAHLSGIPEALRTRFGVPVVFYDGDVCLGGGVITATAAVAMPTLADPNFSHSVTLVCEHNERGALGIVINRPLEMRMSEVLDQLSIKTENAQLRDMPVLAGGPVQRDRGFLLHRPGALKWESTMRVSDSLHVTTSRDILAAMARGERWDDAIAERVLAANEHALAAFTRASRAPAFQSPPIRDIRADVPDMLPWLQLAQASALRALAIGLGFSVFVLVIPAAAPPPVAAIGPLPACRLADIPTLPNNYDSWSTTLVDWLLTVGPDYAPPDLVPVGQAGIAGGGYVRQVAIDDLREMTAAAAAASAPIAVLSPYRSYQQQVDLFNVYVGIDGYEDATTYSARPGHSEHQLGLGVDFMSPGGGSPMNGDWMTTPAGRWMSQNAWTYGWVLSYPVGKNGAIYSDVTCFRYEPWHYRYLGREMAGEVHASGLTIREYLWYYFTQVDPATGLPIATATPSPSPTPTPPPTATPVPTTVPTSTPSAAPSSAPQPDNTLFGVEPTTVLAGLLMFGGLAAIGFAIWRGLLRR